MLWTVHDLPETVDSTHTVIYWDSNFVKENSRIADNILRIGIRVNSIYYYKSDINRSFSHINAYHQDWKTDDYRIHPTHKGHFIDTKIFMDEWHSATVDTLQFYSISSNIKEALFSDKGLDDYRNTFQSVYNAKQINANDTLFKYDIWTTDFDSILAKIESLLEIDTIYNDKGNIASLMWIHHTVKHIPSAELAGVDSNGIERHRLTVQEELTSSKMRLDYTNYIDQAWTTARLYRDDELVWTAKRKLISFKD